MGGADRRGRRHPSAAGAVCRRDAGSGATPARPLRPRGAAGAIPRRRAPAGWIAAERSWCNRSASGRVGSRDRAGRARRRVRAPRRRGSRPYAQHTARWLPARRDRDRPALPRAGSAARRSRPTRTIAAAVTEGREIVAPRPDLELRVGERVSTCTPPPVARARRSTDTHVIGTQCADSRTVCPDQRPNVAEPAG